MRNYHPAFVDRTNNDHVVTDMHKRAMAFFWNSTTTVTESPIVTSLFRSSIDPTTQDQIKRKFDITYTVAKEMLAFTKMDAICELEERHGADLGQGYKNDHSCATFV